MNAYQRAMYTLETGSCYKIEGYAVIDELIEPLCKLLTDNGYITMHSCSAHVVNTFGNKDNQWYVQFIATHPIKEIKKACMKINKKYNYNIEVYKSEYKPLTRRWVIEYLLPSDFDENQLKEINNNIYIEFNNYFKTRQ